MKFSEFEAIMSSQRINRYVQACEGHTKKAITLYRLNLRLSQEMFTIVSCFEVALRNAIDQHILSIQGSNWLQNSVHMRSKGTNQLVLNRLSQDLYSYVKAHVQDKYQSCLCESFTSTLWKKGPLLLFAMHIFSHTTEKTANKYIADVQAEELC